MCDSWRKNIWYFHENEDFFFWDIFITAAPSLIPTITPSKSPITTVPSALPTITGAISAVTLTTIATDDLSSSDISEITSQLAEIYGVDPAEIETAVGYVTSGVLDVNIPFGISNNEAVNSLQESISEVLNVHVSDVIVSIDDDGVVSYSISSDSFDAASSLQDSISEDEFLEEVTSELQNADISMEIESISIGDEIDLIVSITVDTTDSTSTMNIVAAVDALAENLGFAEAETQGIIVFQTFPSIGLYLKYSHFFANFVEFMSFFKI